MKIEIAYIEARKRLLERKNGSLRQLAQSLGYPSEKAAVLSDILHGRWDHVSLDALNDLRIRLDLPPIQQRLAAVCPSCGRVHGEGLDCHGQPVADVIILRPGQKVIAAPRPRKRRLRKSIHVSPSAWERLNTARQTAELTWEEFLHNAIDSLTGKEK